MNGIFKRVIAAVLCLALCCSGLTSFAHADTHDHSEDLEWSASSACSHKYDDYGVCKKCKEKFKWTLNKNDAGMYIVQDICSPHKDGPYKAHDFDILNSLIPGTAVKVNGSLKNAFGNKWYQIKYDGNKTGYLHEDHLKPCKHDYKKEVTKEVTCTTDGKVKYTCSKCKDSYTETIKSDGKHKYDDYGNCKWCGVAYKWTLNKSDAGIYIAQDISSPHKSGPYKAHDFDVLNSFAPGATVKVNGSLINAFGNKWYQITYDGGKTGYLHEDHLKIHKCDYKSKVTVEATCTTDGTKTFTCSICKASYTETIKSPGKHDYKKEVTKEVTCTTDGKVKYTCSKCKDSYTETVKSEGKHKYDDYGNCKGCGVAFEWTLNKDDAGIYIAQDISSPHKNGPYKAHDFDILNSFTPGTAVTVNGSLINAFGNKWYQITYDGNKIGYLHEDHLKICKHDYKKEVTKEVTCETDGKVKYTCSKCGHSYTETVKSEGKHKYDDYGNCKGCGVAFKWTLNKDDAGMYIVQDICSPHKSGPYKAHDFDVLNSFVPGKVIKVNGSLKNAFGNKWYQITYDDGKTGYLHEDHLKPCKHDFETKVNKEATCKDDGEKLHTCKVCGHKEKEAIKATGKHKYGINGKCTWCDAAYEWKLNTEDAGTYLITKLITVFVEPYLVSGVDATAVYTKGQAVKVTGSLINSENNKWYQISYGNGKIGYIFEDYLTKCKHEKYEKDGRCAACGDEFVWKLNTADAGTYTAVDAFNPRKGPYDVTKKDTDTSFVKGNGVKVTGSLKNAFGNKWYQISYGNGQTGYVYETHVILCNHSYNSKITKEATCSAEGTKVYTCSKCSHSYKETIKKLAHNWKNATCTVPKTCTVCGATDGKAPGHSWVDATVTTPKTCAVCGVTEGQVAVCTHNYEATVTKEATCTQAGEKTYICSICGDNYKEAIPVLSHEWEAATCFVPKTCALCGATEGTALPHKWTGEAEEKHCSVCGLEGDENDVPHTHSWVDATCTTPKTCKDCGETEGSALGHSQEGAFRNDDKQHWINCKVCDEKVSETVGDHSGDPCTVCGYEKPKQPGDDPGDKPTDGIWGDADRSGKVNAKDAMLILQYYTKKITEDKLNTAVSDVDGNGRLNAKDAMLVLQKYTKKIDLFPVEETTDEPAECTHNWTAATCTAPKTCSVCGETSGKALGHNWKDATYDAPKTCTVCGKTDGTALTPTTDSETALPQKIYQVDGDFQEKYRPYITFKADMTCTMYCNLSSMMANISGTYEVQLTENGERVIVCNYDSNDYNDGVTRRWYGFYLVEESKNNWTFYGQSLGMTFSGVKFEARESTSIKVETVPASDGYHPGGGTLTLEPGTFSELEDSYSTLTLQYCDEDTARFSVSWYRWTGMENVTAHRYGDLAVFFHEDTNTLGYINLNADDSVGLTILTNELPYMDEGSRFTFARS